MTRLCCVSVKYAKATGLLLLLVLLLQAPLSTLRGTFDSSGMVPCTKRTPRLTTDSVLRLLLPAVWLLTKVE